MCLEVLIAIHINLHLSTLHFNIRSHFTRRLRWIIIHLRGSWQKNRNLSSNKTDLGLQLKSHSDKLLATNFNRFK